MKLSLNHVVLSIVSFIFLISDGMAAESLPKLQGKYEIMPNLSRQEVKDSIDVLEFMSFFCGHCYALFQNEPALKGKYPHKLKFKYIPIQWGNASTKPAEAFLIATEMGKGDEMRAALFVAAFEQRRDISDILIIEAIASEIGLGKEFDKRIASNEKQKEVEHNMELSREFKIEYTPTVILAGNVKVSPNMTDSKMIPMMQNLDSIISSLLRKK